MTNPFKTIPHLIRQADIFYRNRTTIRHNAGSSPNAVRPEQNILPGHFPELLAKLLIAFAEFQHALAEGEIFTEPLRHQRIEREPPVFLEGKPIFNRDNHD